MEGHSHAISGLAAGAAVAEFGLHLPLTGVVTFAAFTAGTVLGADLDQCGSSASRSLGFLSWSLAWAISKLSGGHRHFTHCAAGIAVFTGLAWLACHYRGDWGGKAGLVLLVTLFASAGLEALHLTRGHLADVLGLAAAIGVVATGYGLALTPAAVAVGWTTHLLFDSFTDSGVMWAYPFSKHRFRLPEPAAFTTGTRPERLIVVPLLLVALAFLAFNEIRLSVPYGTLAARGWTP